MNITISGDAVAWYGAIVATASVFVGGYAVWRDRARLKVRASGNATITDRAGKWLVLTVCNVGKRDIAIQMPWVEVRREGGKTERVYASERWSNDKLEVGLQDMVSFPMDKFQGGRILRVVVPDASGKKWKTKVEG